MWQCSPWKDTNGLCFIFFPDFHAILMQSQNKQKHSLHFSNLDLCSSPFLFQIIFRREVSVLVNLSHSPPLIHKDIYTFKARYFMNSHGASERDLIPSIKVSVSVLRAQKIPRQREKLQTVSHHWQTVLESLVIKGAVLTCLFSEDNMAPKTHG